MKVLLAGFLAMLTLSANAEDMQKYLADTQEMVRQGKHQEALDRFIWFHEHALENDRGMTGVRLSFALSYWKAGTVLTQCCWRAVKIDALISTGQSDMTYKPLAILSAFRTGCIGSSS
jgi:hypothetical protein